MSDPYVIEEAMTPMLPPARKKVPGGASSHGSHQLSEVFNCPRSHHLHYRQGYRAKQQAPFHVEGQMAHIALAYWFAQRLEAKPDWFLETSLIEALEQEGAGYPDAIDFAKRMLPAYAQFYGADEAWEIVAVEKEFEASAHDLYKLAMPRYADTAACRLKPNIDKRVSCRIDLLVRCNGQLWAVDYKTMKWGGRSGGLSTFNPQGEYAIKWQFLLQTGILRHTFGAEFGGVIVERITKTEPFAFDRSVVPVARRAFIDLPATVERCIDEEERWSAAARRAEATPPDASWYSVPELWLPTAHWWSCYSYGRPCEYRQVCLAESDAQRRHILQTEYMRKGI